MIKKIKYLVFITIILGMTGCGGYYCKEGDKLSGTKCYETYSPILTCPSDSQLLLGGKCVKRTNVNFVQGEPVYGCRTGDERLGDRCISTKSYDAYRK